MAAKDQLTLEGAAFGAGIVFLRTLRGWSRPALKRACGWKPNDTGLGKYEKGTRIPGPGKREDLARALQVPVATFYDLQRAFLQYVRVHPVELDRLLRAAKLQIESSEVKEVETSYGGGTLDEETERRWAALAREKGAIEQREVLLTRDTVLRTFLQPPNARSEGE